MSSGLGAMAAAMSTFVNARRRPGGEHAQSACGGDDGTLGGDASTARSRVVQCAPHCIPTHFTALDALVLAAYFVGTLAAGPLLRHRSRSVEGFTAASRSLPGWVTGLAILGTYVSSITFLALPAKAYAGNWNPLVFSLTVPLATWAAVRWFLPFYRRSGHVSAYAHLEARFGPWARVCASASYLATQLARMGTVLYLMALQMAALLGWDIGLIIVATAVSVTFYSLIGGALACAGVMVFSVDGGLSAVADLAASHHKFSLGSFGPELTAPTFWVVFVYGLAINLQNFGIDQDFIQRYLASKSDREARKSVWLGGLTYLPLSEARRLCGARPAPSSP